MFPYKFGGTALLGVYLLASNIQQQPIATQVTDDLLAADAKQYFAFDVGPTVESLIASGRQFDKVHSTYLLTSHPHAEVSPGHAPLADPLADFSALVWNCDAAVLATPTARRSALTVGHKFIFSDYTVSLDRVYFDNTHSLSPGGTIVVSRAGGATVLNSVNIRAIETEFPLFRLNERYAPRQAHSRLIHLTLSC